MNSCLTSLVFISFNWNWLYVERMYLFVCISGDYEVSIKFNDEHIPDSPFIVPVATLSDDARRLTVTSLQVKAFSIMIRKFGMMFRS